MSDGVRLLELIKVEKSFGDVQVLHNINLEVAKNEFLTILGPSGSGKTTILRLIGGFERPSSGQILFGSQDITDTPVNRRPFNTVFQDYALFPHLSVRRNVGYGLMVRGVTRATLEQRVAEVLGVVGLDSFANRLPQELSGGQRQRVALARAIICEPRLILLDEPLAALDVALRAQMCAFLKDMQRRLEIAFVFITHDQQEAIAMSDRIIVMKSGRIEQTGTPQELYSQPKSRFVADFFGENNILEGRLVATSGESSSVDTALGIIEGRHRAPAARQGDVVHIAVRPEHVVFAEPGLGLPFVVRNVQFAGFSTIVDAVDERSRSVVMRLRLAGLANARPPSVGDTVSLTWDRGVATIMDAERDAH